MELSVMMCGWRRQRQSHADSLASRLMVIALCRHALQS